MSPVAELAPVLIWMSNADNRCTLRQHGVDGVQRPHVGGCARERMARDGFIRRPSAVP